MKTVNDFFEIYGGFIERVIFNVFKDGDRKIYEDKLLGSIL